MEELVAELSSAFLCAACRIDGRLQHVEYIGSWLKALRNDKRAIFVASAKAQQAADLLLNRSTETLINRPSLSRPDLHNPPRRAAVVRPESFAQGVHHERQLLRPPRGDQRQRPHREEGSVQLPELAVRRRTTAASRPRRQLGGPSIRRAAVPADRNRVLRRGRRHRAGRDPVARFTRCSTARTDRSSSPPASTSTPRSSAPWSRRSRCTVSVSTSTPARICPTSRRSPRLRDRRHPSRRCSRARRLRLRNCGTSNA